MKTLLVHLELAGVLETQYSYFEELAFKFLVDRDEIIRRFDGERREFRSPASTRFGLHKLATFGALEDYRYREVEEWVAGQIEETRQGLWARVGPHGRAAAGGGTRTHTRLPSPDFESGTSTNSITPA